MPAESQAPGEIVNTRALPWTCAQVWGAFSDPTALATWWGPDGFTNTFHEFDFRAGGAWKFTMHAPDGASYPMDHVFLEVVAPERLVIRHRQAGHDFTLTITLRASGAGTDLRWRQRFDDPAEGERLRSFLGPANEQNLDRLAALLARRLSGNGPDDR
jgi:uncharacterized protein YndB with AHSA1/START domain